MFRLKRISVAVALGVAALCVRADFIAADAVVSAPAHVRGSLSAQKLADLVEYARAGMIQHTEKNAAGSEARIWALDTMRAEIQTGPGRMVTLHLLPVKNDTVIAVIETLTSQEADSRMTIYSRDWHPQHKLWKEPKPSEWGRVEPLPILLVEYAFTPETGILTLTNNSEDKEKMLRRMQYKWTPKGFKKIRE